MNTTYKFIRIRIGHRPSLFLVIFKERNVYEVYIGVSLYEGRTFRYVIYILNVFNIHTEAIKGRQASLTFSVTSRYSPLIHL
jgi:hypothetical protein